jgi:hypothetical protein
MQPLGDNISRWAQKPAPQSCMRCQSPKDSTMRQTRKHSRFGMRQVQRGRHLADVTHNTVGYLRRRTRWSLVNQVALLPSASSRDHYEHVTQSQSSGKSMADEAYAGFIEHGMVGN